MRVGSIVLAAVMATTMAGSANLRALQDTSPIVTTTTSTPTTSATTTTTPTPTATTATPTTSVPATTIPSTPKPPTTSSPSTTSSTSPSTTAPTTTPPAPTTSALSQSTTIPSTPKPTTTSSPSTTLSKSQDPQKPPATTTTTTPSTDAPIVTNPVVDSPLIIVTDTVTTTSKPTLGLASTDKGTSTGTYLGIGAGVLAGLGLIGAIIYFLLKRQNDDNNDDDQVSPGFKDLGNDPTYGAPAPAAYKANPPPQKYEPTKLAPANYTVHEPQPQPSPSPVPILQAPTVEYHNIHTNNSTILNTFRSAQEDNDFEEAHPHGSNRHMNEGGAYGGGGKVWTSAKHEDSHGEVGFDPEFESSSYNSSANQSAFNDDYDLQSEGSRDSSFGTRNSFQSHMSSDLDHNDFPVHKEPSAAERGSYEL